MILKKINYVDITETDTGYAEIEAETSVRFLYSLNAIKLYREKTGKLLFNEFSKIAREFTSILSDKKLLELLNKKTQGDISELNLEEDIELLPIVTNEKILNFIYEVTPCLYTKIFDGKFLQNEETYEECINSLWFMNLINFEFFIEIFAELSAPQNKKNTSRGKNQKKN